MNRNRKTLLKEEAWSWSEGWQGRRQKISNLESNNRMQSNLQHPQYGQQYHEEMWSLNTRASVTRFEGIYTLKQICWLLRIISNSCSPLLSGWGHNSSFSSQMWLSSMIFFNSSMTEELTCARNVNVKEQQFHTTFTNGSFRSVFRLVRVQEEAIFMELEFHDFSSKITFVSSTMWMIDCWSTRMVHTSI